MWVNNSARFDQRRILSTAVSEGYFEVPRQITLSELGEQLRLSDVETSQQLRRALDLHLRETLSEFDSP